jgi:hypothetical protein
MLLVAALVAAAAGRAHAGAAEELGSDLETYANIEANLGDSTSWETLEEEQKTRGKGCDDLVKKAAKKLKADDELVAWRLGDHPNARQVGDKYAVKVKDLGWFCDRYRQRLDQLQLGKLWESSQYAEKQANEGLGDEDKKNIRANGDEVRKNTELCSTLVTRLKDSGAGDDFVLKGRYDQTTLGVMAGRCDWFSKQADVIDAQWKIASVEFEKPFRDAGITGDRLSWFVYYGPGIEVWYLKGCKGETSLKKIKKAKLLFQWLEGNDGITIRRFQWKGDKLVKQTEKVYLTEKAAYKGCR